MQRTKAERHPSPLFQTLLKKGCKMLRVISIVVCIAEVESSFKINKTLTL